jgi:predicted Rossmann fold flavoprotein
MAETIIVDVIVIGAGPAGLFTALTCAGKGLKVCLLEKKASPGLKLLISGTGQCNVTHAGPIGDFLPHYGEKNRFVRQALYGFSNSDLVSFFEERGLPFKEVNAGKIFPETLNSRDVLRVLMNECLKQKVTISYNSGVTDIIKSAEYFDIYSAESHYQSKNVVIATGGRSYPSTGSTGDGYAIAQAFGHSIADVAPSLAPVYINDFFFTPCAGISLDQANIQLYRNGKKIRQTSGDVLFTHKGISGPGIIDFSRYLLPGDTLKLSLVDFKNTEEFEKNFLSELLANGKKLLKNLLTKYDIPERLIVAIFELHGISSDIKSADLDKRTRKLIVESLMELPFVVDRLGGFKEAMATRGGVSLNEVNPNTMESRIVKGLYFAGEVLDVDGDTGGYNIQFACSSGVMAGKNIQA